VAFVFRLVTELLLLLLALLSCIYILIYVRVAWYQMGHNLVFGRFLATGKGKRSAWHEIFYSPCEKLCDLSAQNKQTQKAKLTEFLV